jgi:ABC-type sulfate transport system substrate-binding protein
MTTENKEILNALSQLSPDALEIVVHVLEARANNAVALVSPYTRKAEIAKAYSILVNLVDEAHKLALEEQQESELEDAIIRRASSVYPPVSV